jgi:hypothetical protein
MEVGMINEREQRVRLVRWATSAKHRAEALQAAAQAAAEDVRRLQESAAEWGPPATAAERAARAFDEAARAYREAAAASEVLGGAKPQGMTLDDWLERPR